MPIDPSIALQFRPPSFTNPQQALMGIQNIENAQTQGQVADSQLAQEQQKQADAQRQMQYQKDLATAMQQYTTLDPTTGAPKTDFDAVHYQLTKNGWGPQAIQFDSDRAKAAQAGYDTALKATQAQAEQLKVLANIAGSVTPVDQTQTNPVLLAQDKVRWNAQANSALAMLASAGLPPDKVAALKAQIAQGWTPQLDAQLQQQAQSVQSAAVNAKQHSDDLAARSSLLQGQHTLYEDHLQRAAQTYNATDEASHQAWLAKQSPDVQADLPQHYDPTNAAKLRTEALTAEQATTAQQQQQNEADTQSYRKSSLGIQNAQVGIEAQNAATQAKREAFEETQAGYGAGAPKLLNQVLTQESNGYRQLRNLANGIQSGKTYWDKTGKPAPMPDDPDTKAEYIQDMKDQYQAISSELGNIADQKNDIMRRMGKTPTVSADDVRAKLADGFNKIVNPGGTPAAAPAAAPKVATMEAVQAYATKYNMPLEKAKQDFINKHYTIQ